jgi:TolA-binding protein
VLSAFVKERAEGTVRSSKITKTAKIAKTAKTAKAEKNAKNAKNKSKGKLTSKTKKKSISDRVSSLERKIRKMNGVVAALEGKVAELQNWRQDFTDDLTSKLDAVDTRLERYKDEIDEFLSIAHRKLGDNSSARTGYKSGLGILVERGGANPVDGNAARIGGGVVYTKG